jgi:opacity protein-like surface antigen
MKKLVMLLLYLSFAGLVIAQEQPDEEDVVYLKNGAVWRGQIVSKTKKSQRIQLRDGSVVVYNPKAIKMVSKEPFSRASTADADSIRTIKIVEDVLERKKREEEEQRRLAELQLILQGQKTDTVEKKERKPWRGYFILGANVGVGIGKSYMVNINDEKINNNNNTMGVNYTMGRKKGVFGIGLNMGLQQTFTNWTGVVDTLMSAETPKTLLYAPVGLDILLDFAPNSRFSVFLQVDGDYAFNLNARNQKGAEDYISITPSLGFKFGKDMSSYIKAGYQINLVDGNMLNYLSIGFGVMF